MSALLSVSAGCAAYAAFGCLHAASFERLERPPAVLRRRLGARRWRALMYVMASVLSVWSLLAWRAHETLYAAVIVVSAVLTLAGTSFVLLRPRYPRVLWASAGIAGLLSFATAVALLAGRGPQ